MILIDPDLDPDARPHASNSKRAPSIDPTPTDRHSRVPSSRTLSRFLREAQAAVRLPGQVSVLLTTDRNIRRLNRQFRGKDKATDVLSFPADPLLQNEEKIAGDLAVSVPTALCQARAQGHPLSIELKVLILHGLLHLAGFDHETDNGQMARRERLLRARLGLPEGLIERTTGNKRTLRSKQIANKAAALKGHGFSRVTTAPGSATALTAEVPFSKTPGSKSHVSKKSKGVPSVPKRSRRPISAGAAR